MKKYCIPLFSGIGNVIQSLPFAFEMRRRYGGIAAYMKGVDFKQPLRLVNGIFDPIFPNQRAVPSEYTVLRSPKRRSFSEYKGWFVENNEGLPSSFPIDFINFERTSARHQIVIWPETKRNWLCKQWMYWEELASKLDDIALVGLRKVGRFKNVTDYRGSLSLLQTGGILKNAKIFIGNEGGIAHYSAALGTRTYIIFGCSDPVKNMPPNNAIPISKHFPCQPCQFTTMIQKGLIFHGCKHRRCLKELTVEDVLRIVK